MKKTLFITVLVIIMFIGNIVYADELTYSDVKETDWYYETFNNAVSNGIILGYTDGTFKPDNTLKFEEFVKMVVVAVEKDDIEPTQEGNWYDSYIDIAIKMEYINDKLVVNVGQNIGRGTMAEVLYNVLLETEEFDKYTEEEISYLSSKFTDLTNDNNETLTIAGMGLIAGYPDSTFKPNNTLTRAEAVTVISRLLDKNMRLTIQIDNISVAEPIENIGIEDLPKVDLSNLYEYPTTTGKSIEEENQYYKNNGDDGVRSFDEFVPEEYIEFMELMHNRDYNTINKGANNYKNRINYFINGRKEYQGIQYKQLRSHHLSYESNSPELIEYINNTKTFIEDFLDKWVEDTIDYNVQVESKFYTDRNLIYTMENGHTAIRGTLRIKYNSHENPSNIKEELDLVERKEKSNYSIYMNSIQDIKVGKWYEIDLDIETICRSTMQGLEDRSWFNYLCINPISINEVK